MKRKLRELFGGRCPLHRDAHEPPLVGLLVATKRQKTKKPNANILSLPDEVLLKIFRDLVLPEVNTGCLAPRHAFALALTNTRFLTLFKPMIHTFVPDLDCYVPPSGSPAHFLSIARIGGRFLREVHLPLGAFAILRELSWYCPNLEKLHVCQGPNDLASGLSYALNLPLRKLSIQSPSENSLKLLVSPPAELCLTDISQEGFREIKRILLHPPKNLVLGFKFSQQNSPLLTSMMECVRDACPNIETLDVSVNPSHELRVFEFAGQARGLIAAARLNSRKSLCKSIKLARFPTFMILSKAHPLAKIQLTCDQLTFSDDGDGVYATGLPLFEAFFTMDLSKLRSVHITPNASRSWKQKLSGLKLDYALVDDVNRAAELCLSIDTARISEEALIIPASATKWEWLSKVNRLRFPAPHRSGCIHISWFFSKLTKAIQFFKGDVLYISTPSRVEHKESYCCPCIREGWKLLRSIDRFEKGGGDAESVKALVKDIL